MAHYHPRDWTEIVEDFRALVRRKGRERIASAIPADPVTVYRLVKGIHKSPTLAMRANIERLLLDAEIEDRDASVRKAPSEDRG